MKYTHLELNKDIRALAGYYTPQKEVRYRYGDRELLYVTGQAVIDASCCAPGSWTYALVPGYIVRWQDEKDKTGLPVSQVEPVTGDQAQKELALYIKKTEGVINVEFW